MEKFLDIVCRIEGCVPTRSASSRRCAPSNTTAATRTAGSRLSSAARRTCAAIWDARVRAQGRSGGQPLPHRPRRRARRGTQARADYGAHAAELNEAFERGGEGAASLAEAIADAAEQPNDFDFLYPADALIAEKIEAIRSVYGADGVAFLPAAQDKLRTFTEQGYDTLPVCMAKTHLSLARPDAPERPHRLHRDGARHPRLHGLRLARPASETCRRCRAWA